MKILYFSWVRDKTGVAGETAAPPPAVKDVGSLIFWLKSRGGGFAAAFDDMSIIRVAVNQELRPMDYPLSASDEVAFFPPVTGG